jgi:hypothetical protein
VLEALLDSRGRAQDSKVEHAGHNHCGDLIAIGGLNQGFKGGRFAALDPKWSGGPSGEVRPPVRETVCRVAKTPPQELGRPFTTRSLSKLVGYSTLPNWRPPS